jgi:ribosome biogenesis GTPase
VTDRPTSTIRLGLDQWGWSPFFAAQLGPDDRVARVLAEHRGYYDLVTDLGPIGAVRVAASLRQAVSGPSDFPAVGDWVVLADDGAGESLIGRRLRRRTALVRRAAGIVPEPQVLAANVHTAFVMTSLQDDLNVRRLERQLALVLADDVEPVVVVTKVDLVPDRGALVAQLEPALAGRIPVVTISNLSGEGIGDLERWLGPATTVALVGSSGVGKSSLVNHLLGDERQVVGELRGDGRGRHTTVRRDLLALHNGALVVDTPGLREVQLWRPEGLDAAFPEIAALVPHCRFADCRHAGEPGCAVEAAVAGGGVAADRLDAYRLLSAELAATADAVAERRRALDRRANRRR